MELAKYIDHTLLRTDAQRADVAKLIEEAKAYHFASVCVSPIWVSYVSEALRDTGIKTCTVIGFPQGATPSVVKAFETKQAVADGADEADFVKTSTGFASGGATAADVRLMRESVGETMGVKAAGGIRSRADAEAMLAAGATRLGTSSGVKIVEA